MVIRYIEFIGSWISYYLLFGRLDFTGFSGSGSFGFLELDVGCFQGYGSGRLDLDSLDFQDLDLDVWIWIRLLSLGYWRRS